MAEAMTVNQFKEKVLNSLVVPESAKEIIRKRWNYHATLTPEERENIYKENQSNNAKAVADSFKEQQIKQKRLNCGLLAEQWENNFANYKADTESQKQAKSLCLNFCKRFPDIKKGVMLWGEPGLGKDHLLHSITQEILKKDKVFDVRYMFSTKIEKQLREEWNYYGENETTNIEEIMLNTDLLLIGDLHRVLYRTNSNGEIKADAIWNVIYRVIDESASCGKPIICATGNHNIQDYDNLLGKPLGSRLAKIMHWHEVRGQDRRREI